MQRCSSTVEPYTRARASPNPPLPSRTTISNPCSGLTPRFQSRLSSLSHSVCSSLLAISQSRISCLPLPSFQNPKATNTTTRLPLRFLRRRLRRSGFSLSLWLADGQPNAVQLHHGRDICDWFVMGLRH